jgi:hypothetical protein
MRVYAHWFVRYFGIFRAIVIAVVVAYTVITSGLSPVGWAQVALALTMLTFGLRAVVGGVEVTGSDYVVRNWLRTRRIPRRQVTGFTEVSVLWSIQWLTDDGSERFMPLSWFSDDAPRPIRRYNAKVIESLRSAL